MIRTRWLILSTLVIVAAIGWLAYRDELARSEAALGDLGDEQVAIARAAGLTLAPATTLPTVRTSLGGLDRPGAVVVMVEPPGEPLQTLAGTIAPAELRAAIAAGDTVIRLPKIVAPALGLPERTAMVGVARASNGWLVAVAHGAERQRDRDQDGRTRMLVAMVLAAGVVSAFAAIIWRKQRSEAQLARELAIEEAAHGRDAELERLSRAATMAALGSGVAHELSTPLGVIVGRAEQLLARAGDDERTARAAKAIIEQADYIDRVVRGLLGLARGAPIALEQIAPETVVADTFALVEHRFQKKGVLLVPHIGEHHAAIRCEPLLLKHALVNLLLNACDASPAGATVELEVVADARELAFVVTDEGDGIAAADVARAVEPFFTTKPVGQGTGLGLAIANEIAKTHRGRLELTPRTPRGTRACITIPIEAARDG